MCPMATRLVALGMALALATSAVAQVPDHLQCFKIKDTSLVLKGTLDRARRRRSVTSPAARSPRRSSIASVP